MSKDQRIVITRDIVYQDLTYMYRRDMRFLPLTVILVALFSALMTGMTVYMAREHFLMFMLALVCDVFILLYMTVNIWYEISLFRHIKRGDFRIVTDKLVGMSESDYNSDRNIFLARYSGRNQMAFYFADNGRVPLMNVRFSVPYPAELEGKSMRDRALMLQEYNLRGANMFEYSPCGDECILVIINNRREDVIRVYNTKIYRFEDGANA
jgi:hypothetical protein